MPCSTPEVLAFPQRETTFSCGGTPGQFADRAKRQATSEQAVEPDVAEGVEPRRLLRDRGQRRGNAVGQLRLDLTL